MGRLGPGIISSDDTVEATPLTSDPIDAAELVEAGTSIFNAWNYGLGAGNSAADNTAALDAAIVAAAGLPVYIPPGEYLTNALTKITDDGVTIFGAGRMSRLVFNTTGAGIEIEDATPTTGESYRISDLSFGNDTNTPASFIKFTATPNIRIERVYFDDCTVTYAIDQVSGEGTKVTDCVFSGVTGKDIRVQAGSMTLYGCTAPSDDVAVVDGGATARVTLIDCPFITTGTYSGSWYDLTGGSPAIFGLRVLNDGDDVTNDIRITAGRAQSRETYPKAPVMMILPALMLGKRLDAEWAVGANAGMRASGAAIEDTTYHIFLIMRPDTGVVDIAADTSATGFNIAANTNVAYTRKRRIWSIVRKGGAIVPFTQRGDNCSLTNYSVDVNGVVVANTNAITRTLTVPTGIEVTAQIRVTFGGHASVNPRLLITTLEQADVTPTTGTTTLVQPSLSGFTAGLVHVRTNTSGQIRSRANAVDGTTILEIGTVGWVDRRDQDE